MPKNRPDCPTLSPSAAGLRATALKIGFCAGSIFIAWHARLQLQAAQADYVAPERPPLYLPEAGSVRLVTGGYDTLAAKLLWFQTVSYFGKQFAAHKDYRWLAHMCELVTKLDPRALHVAQFCGTLLPWVAHEPERGAAILSGVIDANPAEWRPRYLRGFIEWYFLEQLEAARSDIVAASKLPAAPPFLASLASRMIAQEHGTALARQFLEETFNNTSDPAVRAALLQKLELATLTERLELLEDARDAYVAARQSLPPDLDTLVTSGYLRALPAEPFGGTFSIDHATGEIRTSSKRKRLHFAGRTARTSELTAANAEVAP